MTKQQFMKGMLKYDPHPKQKLFHNNTCKYRGFIGGLGSGKSAAGAVEALTMCLKYPGIKFVILAPTYPMLIDATMPAFWKWCPPDLILKHNQSRKTIELVNGSEILYRPCDNRRVIDKLRGIEIGGFWIDEAALVPYYAWKVLIGRLRQNNMPLIGFLTTTPKGFGWLYDKFVQNKDEKKLYYYVHATSYDNTHLPEGYVEDLKYEYGGIFAKQEIMGEFVGHEGLVYNEFSRNIHTISYYRWDKFKRVICGIDWGFTNPNVCLWIALDGDNRVYILRELYKKRQLTDDFIKEIKIINETMKIKPDTYYADPSEPEFILKFKNNRLSTREANNEIMPGIKEVSKYLTIQEDGKPRLFVHENCINTIMEFENYRYPEGEEDKPTQEKPIKIYDHCLIAETKVITLIGEKEISKIKVGEYVLTRQGFKKVRKSGITLLNVDIYELSLSNGRKLYGTRHHPIYVKDKGFIRMDALRNNYILVDALRYLWEQLFITETNTEKTNKQDTGNQMDYGKKTDSNQVYIDRNGKTNMEKFLKIIISIIKMETKTITILKILSVYQLKNILKNIRENMTWIIWKGLGLLQKFGIKVRKEKNGIQNIGKSHYQKLSKKENISVNNVENNLLLEQYKEHNIVTRTANKEPVMLGLRKLNKTADVYNLTVEDCPEFFAEGILVHNSMDSMRYALMTMKQRFSYGFLDVGKVEAKPDGTPKTDKTKDVRVLNCLNCDLDFRTFREFKEGTEEQICKDCKDLKQQKRIIWDGTKYCTS